MHHTKRCTGTIIHSSSPFIHNNRPRPAGIASPVPPASAPDLPDVVVGQRRVRGAAASLTARRRALAVAAPAVAAPVVAPVAAVAAPADAPAAAAAAAADEDAMSIDDDGGAPPPQRSDDQGISRMIQGFGQFVRWGDNEHAEEARGTDEQNPDAGGLLCSPT